MLYDLRDRLLRRWVRIYGHGLVWLAGFILIVAGIICLVLSDQVITGWWQGTLDAFGVGFIVAGIVDVLAISALNQVTRTEDQRRQDNNRLGESILRPLQNADLNEQAQQARDLLNSSGGNIDRVLASQLWKLVDARWPPEVTPDER